DRAPARCLRAFERGDRRPRIQQRWILQDVSCPRRRSRPRAPFPSPDGPITGWGRRTLAPLVARTRRLSLFALAGPPIVGPAAAALRFTGRTQTARPSASSKSSCANAPMAAVPVLTGTPLSAATPAGAMPGDPRG